MGLAADNPTIYGEPVERAGITVIPVSKAMYGYGGGAGAGSKEDGSGAGSGGGGGVALQPVGYIEIKEGETRVRSIRDPQTVVKIVVRKQRRADFRLVKGCWLNGLLQV